MNVTYDVKYIGYTYHIKLNETNECPICKHSLKPTILHKELLTDNNGLSST